MKVDKVLRNMHEHIESNLPAPPVAIKYWKEAFEELLTNRDAEIERLQRLLMRSTDDGQRLLDALNDIANRGVPVQREEHRIARAALAEVKDA